MRATGSRRVRASFLLRAVTLVASLGLFWLVFRYLTSAELTAVAFVLLVLFWFVGIEMGLLPYFIQRAVVAKAGGVESVTASIWFVETSAEPRRETEKLERDSRDNPTIR